MRRQAARAAWRLAAVLMVVALCAPPGGWAAPARELSLAARIQRVIRRPVFRHARFGIEFYSLETHRPVYELNPHELFAPASTTKLLTEGAALALLGPDYRFRTPIYRTGPIGPDGRLHGALVLVASGDPNLSQRIQPDGTLAFQNNDHCYGGPPVPGYPLVVIEQLARQVAAHGVRRLDGPLLVDATLFPEGKPELGTQTIISPVVINDNIVDVTAGPGPGIGSQVALHVSPETSYVNFINRAITGLPGSEPDIKWSADRANPDGTHTVTVTGTMPLNGPSAHFPYAIPQPSRFAQIVLAAALRKAGVEVSRKCLSGPAPNFKALSASYTPQNLLAEHVSPPFFQDVRLTLKVSQNLHASLMPYILGAVLAHATQNIDQAGFDLERRFLEMAGLDLSGASQSDGAGGSGAALFTPDFMVHYLAYVHRQKYFPQLFAGLPVLGIDGTLADIQRRSPAADHVFAKTGTFDLYDELNRNDMVTAKGLAGYLTTRDGRLLTFAIYVNDVAVPGHGALIDKIVGEALGEIATAAYLAP